MSLPFQINFRREAFQRERAMARVRVLRLAGWAAYLGVLAVLSGLYLLNLSALDKRTRDLERMVQRARALDLGTADWRPPVDDLPEIQRHAVDARRWSERLARLGDLLPDNAQLTSVQWNPDNLSGAGAKLVLAGVCRVPAGQDRMQSVMTLVRAMQADSSFIDGLPNIRLVTTSATETGDGARFVIECR